MELNKNKSLFKKSIYTIIVIGIIISISSNDQLSSYEINNKNESSIIIEKIFASKFCDAVDKKLFNGLEKESTLKNEYYLGNLPQVNNNKKIFDYDKFKNLVVNYCSYNITDKDTNEILNYFRKIKYNIKLSKIN